MTLNAKTVLCRIGNRVTGGTRPEVQILFSAPKNEQFRGVFDLKAPKKPKKFKKPLKLIKQRFKSVPNSYQKPIAFI